MFFSSKAMCYAKNCSNVSMEENRLFPCALVLKGNCWCLKEPWYGDKTAYSVTAIWQASEYFRSPVQCLTHQFSTSTLSLTLCRNLFVPQPLKRCCAFCITCHFQLGTWGLQNQPDELRTSRDLNPTLGEKLLGTTGFSTAEYEAVRPPPPFQKQPFQYLLEDRVETSVNNAREIQLLGCNGERWRAESEAVPSFKHQEKFPYSRGRIL